MINKLILITFFIFLLAFEVIQPQFGHGLHTLSLIVWFIEWFLVEWDFFFLDLSIVFGSHFRPNS